ncbi:MAG TPA: GAF domain-containing protein, partial [Acidobacteriaceae bacterium]
FPLWQQEQLLGCIEIASFEGQPSADSLHLVQEIADQASVALVAALRYESERNANLAAVSRMVQLYDIEKVFNATLEMSALLPVICDKVQTLTDASAVNLWLVADDGELRLMRQAGSDPRATTGDRLGGGDSLVARAAEDGEPLLFSMTPDEEDAEPIESDGPASILCAPIVHDGSLVGVLEVVSYDASHLYTEDDLFMMTQVADSAAQALHNSSLLIAERKIEVLQTLVGISREITATLNHQQVLQAVVNEPLRVISCDRAAIALEERGRLTVRAVSGIARVDPTAPEIAPLQNLLRWVAGLECEIHIWQKDDEISDDRPETREKFRSYFEQSGAQGFFAIPLSDDEGRVGVLSFESSDPDFLSDLQIEIIHILAGQATVAIRNASLYHEVPFLSVLQPVMEKRRRFLAMERRRKAWILSAAALALLLLILLPVPMRISGKAVVAPVQTESVRAAQDGVVEGVFVREGQNVDAGTPLLQMADWTQRADLASVQARYNTASADAARALESNDATAAGQHQLEANYLAAELGRAREQLSQMTVRAYTNGVVSTPHVESLIGKKVLQGDPLLEMVSTGNIIVDVAIPQGDFALVHAGDSARIKLESLPVETLRGRVRLVSAAAQPDAGESVFFARIELPNPQGSLRPGMQGFAKISTGLRPLGYVLFRSPALWVWSKLWYWFGL